MSIVSHVLGSQQPLTWVMLARSPRQMGTNPSSSLAIYRSAEAAVARTGWATFCQSQLAEEQHEQIFLLNIGFLNLQCYFGEAICTGLFRTDFLHGFLHGFSARIFCTDFLHGFFARNFCTDFLHGFFCTVTCTIFCTDFCADCLQELFVQMLHGFLHGFFGVSQNTCWEAPKFHRENPLENSPCFGGLLGGGLGRQDGEVRLWPAWPSQSLRGLGGLGGHRWRK